MIAKNTERRMLQIAFVLGGIVPVSAGLAGVVMGVDMLQQGTIEMDSHYRYLSGLLLAIGLCFWASVPAIETHTARIRLLAMLVVVGGLARLFGYAMSGAPPLNMQLALGMELVVTPLLAFWQSRFAARA